jgi:elastase-2
MTVLLVCEKGDDGGPMNFYNAECGRWFVLGVAGRGNSFDDGINGPNIFTRVQAHLEFIQNHTRVSSPADCSSTTNGTEPTTTTGPTTSTTQKIATTSTEKTTTPTTTASTTNRPVTFSCAGKANGNYPNPESSCSNTFYTCSNGNAYLFVS